MKIDFYGILSPIEIFFNFMKNRIFLLNFETDLALYVALEVSISMLRDLYALQICTMTY